MVSQNSSNLQREMQTVRKNLDDHAEEMVQKAKSQFDWRHYVAGHPWLAMGAAVAAGYFLVPRRTVYTVVHRSAPAENSHQSAAEPQHVAPAPLAGLLSEALSIATTIAVREGMAIASQFARQWLQPREQPSDSNAGETRAAEAAE